MLGVLTVALLFATPTVDDSSSPEGAHSPWELYVGLSAGTQAPERGFTGATRLGLTREVNHWLRPEFQVLLGTNWAPQEMHSGIRAGARFELRRDGAIPFLSLAFAHQHESPFEAVRRAPVGFALGLSEDHVTHRTGLELGAGVFGDFGSARMKSVRVRFGIRASAVALLGAGAPFSLESVVTSGLLF